jgi:hypothetical protein
MPDNLKKACFDLASQSILQGGGTGAVALAPNIDTKAQAVTSETVGPISVTYTGRLRQLSTVYRNANMLIAPLLRNRGSGGMMPDGKRVGVSSFYTGLQETASRLLKTYGAQRAFIRRTTGTYDASIGKAPITDVTAQVFMVTFPFTKKQVDGKTVKATDLQGYFDSKGLAFTPEAGDKCTVDGLTYSASERGSD